MRWTLAMAALAAMCIAGRAQAATPSRPNIIFILADDLGFEAVGAYGGAAYQDLGPVRTPNIDALAAGGMRFGACFATPVCSPARSELLTGKYNFRTGFIDIAGRRGAVSELDPKAHPTLAMALKSAGYVTAVVGKWHVGPPESMKLIPQTADADTDYPHPRECGFDRQCIFGGAHLEIYGDPKAGTYTPDRLQDWTMRFLDSRKGKSEPFFLYYASPIPHFPILPTPLNPDGPAKGRNTRANFPFLVQYLDKQVGQLLAKLDELGLRQNTIVMFSGDNGTDRVSTQMRDGRVIPGGKDTLKDTGSWVPLIANWPGVIKPGSTCDNLVDFTDILPSCLELAGVEPRTGIDGISFAPALLGKNGPTREWIQVCFVHAYFVRDKHWKLRENGELYDVSNSPYAETLIPRDNDTLESKTARQRLGEIMLNLHPK